MDVRGLLVGTCLQRAREDCVCKSSGLSTLSWCLAVAFVPDPTRLRDFRLVGMRSVEPTKLAAPKTKVKPSMCAKGLVFVAALPSRRRVGRFGVHAIRD